MTTIKQIKDTNNELHDIGVKWSNVTEKPDAFIGYGTCGTAASTSAKVVTMTDSDWHLEVGNIIGVKFTNSNSASNVTLNVNETGAKNIWYNNAKYTSSSSSICGYANRVTYYMYDGTYWVWMNMGSLDGNTDTNTVPSIQIETAMSTTAKTGTCTNYSLLAKSYAHVNVRYANGAQSALTLNVNSKGAKPIYINGTASSSSNYTLPAGTYIVYYDGTNYHFRTDGVLPGSILNATNATNDESGNRITTTYVKTILPVNYSLLVILRNGGNLIPGQQYRITNYITTTSQANTESAGHQFDIIVTADSNNTLSEIASVCLHEGDTYFSENNANLSAWKIWYCLDNDVDRFEWADENNGRGVIYRMIDEWGNDCPYDFKNIQFIKPHITKPGEGPGFPEVDYYYTFCIFENSSNIKDASINVNYYNVYNNVIKPYHLDNKQSLNRILFFGYPMSLICYSNTFGDDCHNIYLGDGYNSNTCHSNTFGDGCYENRFYNDCYSNTFGSDCHRIIFGDRCYSNTFGDRCYGIYLGDVCYSNTFGDDCYNIAFGDRCYSNTFGDRCYSNNSLLDYKIFGDDCYSNTFVNDYCYDKNFIMLISNNVFNNGVSFNDGIAVSGDVVINGNINNTGIISTPTLHLDTGGRFGGKIVFGDYHDDNVENHEGHYTCIEEIEDDELTFTADIGFIFNSDRGVISNSGFFDTSDERLKDIVKPIEVDLDKLSKLRKVYFNWKDKENSSLQLGMIAQDVQEIYPELINESKDGILSLAYDKLSVITLEAIDVLHNENNELKNRIDKLESLVNQLIEKN